MPIGDGGDVLLQKSYVVVVDESGAATIDLPVKSSGTITYRYELPANNGVSKGTFNLEAGSAIDLSNLIAGSPEASDSVRDYIDAAVAALRPYRVFAAQIRLEAASFVIETVLENSIGGYTTGTHYDDVNGFYIGWIAFDGLTPIPLDRVWCSHPVAFDNTDVSRLVYGPTASPYFSMISGDYNPNWIAFFGKTAGSSGQPGRFPIEIRLYNE